MKDGKRKHFKDTKGARVMVGANSPASCPVKHQKRGTRQQSRKDEQDKIPHSQENYSLEEEFTQLTLRLTKYKKLIWMLTGIRLLMFLRNLKFLRIRQWHNPSYKKKDYNNVYIKDHGRPQESACLSWRSPGIIIAELSPKKQANSS
jgi:hypothetical protein